MRTFRITYEVAETDREFNLSVVKNFDDEMKAVAYAQTSEAGMPGCTLKEVAEIV